MRAATRLSGSGPLVGLGRCDDPAGITGGPLAIGAHLGEHCVDEPDKVEARPWPENPNSYAGSGFTFRGAA